MNRKVAALTAIVLIFVIALTLFLTRNSESNQTLSREFYVGVEYAYSENIADLKALVDKVKDYTNLFVMGDVRVTFNETALTEACDYIYNAKLNFIVLFTGLDMYENNYNITQWMLDAKARYGSSFLGIDRYDEPGGNQIDNGRFQLINSTDISPNATYSQVAQSYVGNLSFFPAYYLQYSPKVFTADYTLYWFDYKAGYSAIFGEFVHNASRERHIALCRGAANAFGRDWGIVITWKYDDFPYLESAAELYSDLSLAYSAGAKYVVVFSYPTINITSFGTLTEQHFKALQQFWRVLHNSPESFGSDPPTVAYVVPADYGFGFGRPDDRIWGIFPPDDLSAKVFDDVAYLTAKYGAQLDVLYNEPAQIEPLLGNYSAVYYWNQSIT